jgi:hypothetical protein
LGLTKNTDKTVAFSGLERRLAQGLHTTLRHGIAEKFLHRSLLWKRTEGRLKRITYPEDRKVPSWSWMAWDGAIDFVSAPWEAVLWNRSMKFPGEDVLQTVVMEFQNCWMEEEISYISSRWILSNAHHSVGSVTFDDIPFAIPELRCVIIGMETTPGWKHGEGWSDGKRCYVLFIKPKYAGESCGEYERVGSGYMSGMHISVKGVEGRIA